MFHTSTKMIKAIEVDETRNVLYGLAEYTETKETVVLRYWLGPLNDKCIQIADLASMKDLRKEIMEGSSDSR